jgi:hypothetical protein
MKSSFHSLIPFLPLFCNCQLNSTPGSSPGRLASRSSTLHSLLLLLFCSQSQSQSHIAIDGQSTSKSWCRAPSGDHDHIFITLWQLRSGSSKPIILFCTEEKFLITTLDGSHGKHSLIVKEACLLVRYLPSNGRPSLARVHFAEMCLQSRCLAMDIDVTILPVCTSSPS